MKTICCPIVFYGVEYKLNSFFGYLISKPIRRNNTSVISDIATNHYKQKCITAVNNPYMMKARKESSRWKNVRYSWITRTYARLLTWICVHCFLLAKCCLSLRLNFFQDASDACMFYYSVYPNMKHQQRLCLPRAIFMATTSKRFKQEGVLFIGTFLPTVRMHAWVVENGTQTDPFDNQWIYYRPVLMCL